MSSCNFRFTRVSFGCHCFFFLPFFSLSLLSRATSRWLISYSTCNFLHFFICLLSFRFFFFGRWTNAKKTHPVSQQSQSTLSSFYAEINKLILVIIHHIPWKSLFLSCAKMCMSSTLCTSISLGRRSAVESIVFSLSFPRTIFTYFSKSRRPILNRLRSVPLFFMRISTNFLMLENRSPLSWISLFRRMPMRRIWRRTKKNVEFPPFPIHFELFSFSINFGHSNLLNMTLSFSIWRFIKLRPEIVWMTWHAK